MPYRELDEANILRTLERLKHRIEERFPDSGLSKVATELRIIASEVRDTVEHLTRPNYAIRATVSVAIALMLISVFALLSTLRLPTQIAGLNEFMPLANETINSIVFLGVAIFFLLSLETRIKRKRTLRTIHQLRSLAHVVDMHQLTKDPERLLSSVVDTASSPERVMSPEELGRYLDYCSELLSVTSKLAALLVQRYSDEVILGAVNEIETLTTGLSNKIWQKIMIIERSR